MESIEKLRNLRDAVDANDVDNPIWVCHKATIIADEIEREIAERYMLLPADADGVPIHVGDEVMYGVGQAAHYVFAVSENAAWLNNSTHPPLVFLQEFTSGQCRHVKPDPVKELLEDFAGSLQKARDFKSHPDMKVTEEEVIAASAEKMREVVMSDERLQH